MPIHRFLSVIMVVGICLRMAAQPTVIEQPVFRTAEDSVAYYRAERELTRLAKAPGGDQKIIDSLMATLNAIRQSGVVGQRRIYTPSGKLPSHTTLIATDRPDTIQRLSLSGPRIRRLPRKISQCTHLEYLELVNTNVGRMQRRVARLTGLKTLHVYNNTRKIRFAKNNTITSLLIRAAKPDRIPGDYSALKVLAKLDLAANELTTFPSLQRNSALKELALKNNHLTLADMKPIPSLERLDLSYNKIVEVPAAVGGFTALRKLIFNYNQISSVSGALAKLSQLEEISFYQNELAKIPDALFEIASLKVIDLYYNKIERLDGPLEKWGNLEVLYLSNNRLIALPDHLARLKSLQELYLHNNKLGYLPEQIGSLANLKVLRVNNNNLSATPSSLSLVTNLEYFDASSNRLEKLDQDFLVFEKLKILSLRHNPWSAESRIALADMSDKLAARNVSVHLDFARASSEP